MNDESALSATQESELGAYLIQAGRLSARDVERAVAAQQEMRADLGSVLLSLGLISEADMTQALSAVLQIPLASEELLQSAPIEVEGLAPGFMTAHRLVPLYADEGTLHLALANPADRYATKAVQLATRLAVRPYVASWTDIQAAIARGSAGREGDSGESDSESADANDFVEHLRDLATEAPVIKLVNQIIGRVVDLRASDIHLEPFEDGLKVRFRVDGVIQAAETIPARQGAAVSSRVKLLAHLDIAERRLPQDGRIKTRVKGHEIDLRVSTVPTVHGESVVMRVLDRSSVKLTMDAVGFSVETRKQFDELLARPHGILLVTGPTGSGKTTTLYAALSALDVGSQKVITVEDPVEYQLTGVNQIQVHPQIGLTFASALRSILRQDPDIIMIGEMRDGETAQIAVQSALTGHLVLSTLHTNNAASAVVRLLDMGVEPYLITSSVVGVLAQRLVRRLCATCKVPTSLPEVTRKTLGLTTSESTGPFYKAVGCADCRQTGYRGRAGIHELLVMDDALRAAILAGEDATALHNRAVQGGMKTLHLDGLRKVAEGVTSLDELLRVTQDQGNA